MGPLENCVTFVLPSLTNIAPYLLVTHLLQLQKRVHHVPSCPCDNTCKRSPVTCRKNRSLCPDSRLLFVSIQLACAEQER